jgi:hypothetical protein
MKALCPFTQKYVSALTDAFPNIRMVIGTHEENETTEEYRKKIKRLFSQSKKSMADVILKREEG